MQRSTAKHYAELILREPCASGRGRTVGARGFRGQGYHENMVHRINSAGLRGVTETEGTIGNPVWVLYSNILQLNKLKKKIAC